MSEAFGSEVEIVNVVITIVLARLWQFYVISSIVPILTGESRKKKTTKKKK